MGIEVERRRERLKRGCDKIGKREAGERKNEKEGERELE